MKKIAYFLFYLLKTYFLSLLTMQSVIFVIAYINYAYFNLCVHEYNPLLCGFILGIKGAIFNFPLFLFFYYNKFTNIEIVRESIVYIMIAQIQGLLILYFTGNIKNGFLLVGEIPKISCLVTSCFVALYLKNKYKAKNFMLFDVKCSLMVIFAFQLFICCYLLKVFPWYNDLKNIN